MNCRAFISYRRRDQPALAEWLYDRLAAELGADDVFFDRETIETGQDFPARIRESAEGALAFVVLIGAQWNPVVSGSIRRLDDPTDFVRLEIEISLKRAADDGRTLILPVLFDGAQAPEAKGLPPSLHALVNYQAQVLPTGQPYSSGLAGAVNTIVRRLDELDTTPPEERWILQQIKDAVEIGTSRVRRMGAALHDRFPHVVPPESARALAQALYRVGPDALECLAPLGNRDGRIGFLLELLATNWIRPVAARQLRETFVGGTAGQNVALDCEYADFTPRETLLKASREVSGWPTLSVKASDSVEEILRQIHEELLLEFSPHMLARKTGFAASDRTEADERKELCRLLDAHRRAEGKDLPVVLRVDHRLALDSSLLAAIRQAFPPLNILIATSDPEELQNSTTLAGVLNPANTADDEPRAFDAFAKATRRLNRQERKR